MYDEALKTRSRAAKLMGNDPVVVEHLGDAYRMKKMWKEALAEWERSLSLDPKNEAVKRKIDELRARLQLPPPGGAGHPEKKEVVKE